MSAFLVLVGVSVTGVIAVFFLLRREEYSAGLSLHDLGSPLEARPAAGDPPAFPLPTSVPKPDAPPKSGFLGILGKKREKKTLAVSKEEVAKLPAPQSFFSRLIPRKKVPAFLQNAGTQERELRAEIPLPALKHFLEEQGRQKLAAVTSGPSGGGSKSSSLPEAQLPAEEEKRIEQEIDLTARLEEWKEKYERLDKIFQEKSAILAKNEELLQAELNNRKEFNKLKDILEKELKDIKDKSRIIQVELNGSRTEAESYKKRVNQLEEKITKMEKALLAKDDEIAGLVKRLEAKPVPPVEAAAPPKPADSEPKAAGDPVATPQVLEPAPYQPTPEVKEPPASPQLVSLPETKVEETQAPNTADTPGKSDPPATNQQDEQKGETNNG